MNYHWCHGSFVQLDYPQIPAQTKGYCRWAFICHSVIKCCLVYFAPNSLLLHPICQQSDILWSLRHCASMYVHVDDPSPPCTMRLFIWIILRGLSDPESVGSLPWPTSATLYILHCYVAACRICRTEQAFLQMDVMPSVKNIISVEQIYFSCWRFLIKSLVMFTPPSVTSPGFSLLQISCCPLFQSVGAFIRTVDPKSILIVFLTMRSYIAKE